jgi:hypothetical protein
MPTKKQDAAFMSCVARDKHNISKKRRTLSCATGLRNLGASARKKRSSSTAGVHHDGEDGPRQDGKVGSRLGDDWVFDIDSDSDVDSDSDNEADSCGYDGPCLPDRPPGKFLPSQRQAMRLLSMAVPPEDRAQFRERFLAFATGLPRSPVSLAYSSEQKVCKTDAAWIASAYGCNFVNQLQCAADMFPSSGMESCFLSEIYVMDVILNRAPFVDSKAEGGGGDDDVLLVRSYQDEDMLDKNDFKFRTMILFLPQCGVFYCARERRKEDDGVPRTHVALDMSWLRLKRSTDNKGNVSYTFGEGGYVKRFHLEEGFETLHGTIDRVSAWRYSLNPTSLMQQKRVVYRVEQCLDSDGPKLSPDVFDGLWHPTIPRDLLGLEYNKRLARANSARIDGRHYAPGCHHYRLPETCWIIDPTSEHFVDIMVDIPQIGEQKHRQSVIMVRNVNFLIDDGNVDLPGAIACITEHNKALRIARRKGAARAKSSDYGTMHAIGTHVHLDGVTVSAYKANDDVDVDLLRHMVVSLSRIGRCAFPQVYAVIRDTEGNCGLEPVSPMDGEGGRRVGYTVDMSVDLGNSSHYDFNDASQGYSLWGEDIPGKGKNWYLVMPNIHGMRRDENLKWVPFAGLAILITHGVSISWDGRDIRHCTSVSEPDGIAMPEGDWSRTVQMSQNHLYGAFTAAKERVVECGRKVSAAKAALGRAEHTESGVVPSRSGKRRRRQKHRKRSHRGRRQRQRDGTK